jgi:hypothetical protein
MRAAALFAAISAESDVREAWLGLATARRRLGDAVGAAEALAAALRRHVPDPGFAPLADAIAREAGAPGWCGLSGTGHPIIRPAPECPPPSIARSRHSRGSVSVTAPDGRHLLGSPLDVAAISATVGCVSANDGCLTGWAWHPGDPNTDPVLRIRPARGRKQISITASDINVRVENSGLLGRPHGFSLSAAELKDLRGPLHVLGRDGKDLLGSPLDPRSDQEAGAAAAAMLARLYPAGRSLPPRPGAAAAMPVAAIVPPMSGKTSRRRSLNNTQFIETLYQNVLGRAGESSGVAYWQSQMNNGETRDQVLLNFSDGFENKEGTISTIGDKDLSEAYRLYRRHSIGRRIAQDWMTTQLDAGTTPLQVAQGFASLSEWARHHGVCRSVIPECAASSR